MTSSPTSHAGEPDYYAEDLVPLLQALKREVVIARRHAQVAAQEVTSLQFDAYHRYRESLTNIIGTVTVLTDRMPYVRGKDAEAIRLRFCRQVAKVMEMRATASLAIFQGLSTAAGLPLGGREVFLIELAELDKALKRLSEPDLAEHLTAEVSTKLETARHVLTEIVEKAPSLLVLAESTARNKRR